MYYSHNLHFLASAYSSDGRLALALRSATRLESNVAPHVKDMPMLEGFIPTRYWVLARFHRWDDILKLPAPPAGRPFQAMMWHYARGMALAAKGNVAGAEKEHAALLESAKPVPPDMVISPVGNTAGMIIRVADKVLAASIVEAREGAEKSIPAWRAAVAEYETVGYAEPPDWYYSARESLGAVLLKTRQYQEAEQVFRHDLELNRRNGRLLYGLALALQGQGRKHDAAFVMDEYKVAWSKADKPLTESDL
jgi:tetratricopeptide (TPR) repeat protein